MAHQEKRDKLVDELLKELHAACGLDNGVVPFSLLGKNRPIIDELSNET